MIINNVEKLIKRTLTTHSATTPESEIEDAPSNIPRAFWLSGFFFPQGNVINFME
jgi:hypothetical protein